MSNPLMSAKPIKSDQFSGQLQHGITLKPVMKEKVLVGCLHFYKHRLH